MAKKKISKTRTRKKVTKKKVTKKIAKGKKKMTKMKRGEAKDLHRIFKETDLQLLGNMMKGLHLDGGGNVNHYKNLARKLFNFDTVADMADFLWDHEYVRTTNLRKSMLKRSTLLKLRLKFGRSNVSFDVYVEAYWKAVEATCKHPKKMKPNG